MVTGSPQDGREDKAVGRSPVPWKSLEGPSLARPLGTQGAAQVVGVSR